MLNKAFIFLKGECWGLVDSVRMPHWGIECKWAGIGYKTRRLNTGFLSFNQRKHTRNPLWHHFSQLLDTKSTDRSQTLLHFITNIIQEKYPDLANFHSDLHFVDKAALGISHQQKPSTAVCIVPTLTSARFSASVPGRCSAEHPLSRTWNGDDQEGVPGAGRQPRVERVHKNKLWGAGVSGQGQQNCTGLKLDSAPWLAA